MRYFVIILFSALLLSACSGAKDIVMGRVDQDPCKNETQLKDQREFVGETVDNLNVYQQGENVYATMDVRTLCNSRISFEPKVVDKTIMLMVKNNNSGTSTCACVTKVTTTFSSPGSGSYNVRIMSQRGDMLLAEQSATIK